MINLPFEHVPKIYRPEDVKFRDGNPYLSIILGQMALELVLKNVGSQEKPIWIAWFDPREVEVQKAGTEALIQILDDMGHLGLAITPFSSKSGPMIQEACREVNLPLLTLKGGKDEAVLKEQVGNNGRVYGYYPITSPDSPKYMAFDEQARQVILRTIKNGQQIGIIDDVYSSGATIKATLIGLKEILGDYYDDTLIEVVTVAREGVIHNGDPLPDLDLDQPLTFEVFIPEVVGDLEESVQRKAS
jgi:hypothetical protein